MKSQDIRQALIQIAERHNRPHYTVCVVRDVLNAFHNDLDHPLKNLVKNEVVIEKPIDNSSLGQLQAFCSVRGVRAILAKHSGISESVITSLLNGWTGLSDDLWRQLSSAFDRTETEMVRNGKGMA